ncbi:MAG TPA: type II secretion system F family protein, partial [Candidatus Syntrophosphaera sp.]|nr:type II secretion system F family protein [Candidatus Syntrophosphaera sp.]
MIFEYRFRGANKEGKPVTGTFTASGGREAQRHLAELRQRYQITIARLEQKRDWLYKVRMAGRAPFSGRQSAYNKEDVAEGLRRLGYEDFKIGRVLFDLPGKPSIADILMFIRLSANMLRDKMNFGKILELLAEEQSNRKMKETLYQIETQLKAGAEGREVFQSFSNVFGRFPAFMLGLATRSGNMADIFDSTAEFIERDVEISKTVRKALLSPLITILATLAAFGYYVLEIFPATATLFTKYDMETPTLTKGTLDFSNWLGEVWWILALAALGVILILWRWWST